MPKTELSPIHYDMATELPTEEKSPHLREVVDLKTQLAPEGASRFVKTKIHVVERANGTTGYQVVNEMAPGVSLVPVDVVNGKGYAVLVDQIRYPHLTPGTDPSLTLEQAAATGRIGRWSRETISGGVDPKEATLGEYGLKLAALREAEEEAGIKNIDPERVQRIFPTLYSSVSVNNQSFNLMAVKLGEGEWSPEEAFPEIEEGNMKVGAYRLDTAVPEMINNGTIWEMSTVTALNGLWRIPEMRQYL